jgi:putative tryptophan/tyrosine transport system substrate-binding protein
MKRRTFITLLGGAAAWPLAARGQQPNVPRIGVLRVAGLPSQPAVEELRQGLRDLGYVEGQNIAIEFRSGEGGIERLPELAAELVGLNVAVLVAYGPQTIQAAKDATTTIPIVMGRMDDADAHGFVTNYSRPDGNVTGLSFQSGELSTKWLELLKEILPPGARIAALWDVAGTSHQVQLIKQAARTIGVDLNIFQVRGRQNFMQAFASAKEADVRGLVILASPVMTSEMIPLAKLTVEHGLAASYMYREFAAAGGLLSYGPSATDASFSFRRAAYFVDKILRGAKPGELPIEQPTRFYLTVNLKAATTLNLTIPSTLLAIADEVIE